MKYVLVSKNACKFNRRFLIVINLIIKKNFKFKNFLK